MKCMICDDQSVTMHALSDLLKKDGRIESAECFSRPDLLLHALRGGQECTLLFLDIRFANQAVGFEVARKLYQEFPSIQIVYVTGYGQEYSQRFMLEEGNIIGFLTKPFEADLVHSYISKAIENLQRRGYLTFSIKGKSYSVLQDTIRSMESTKHTVEIRTSSGCYTVYEKLSELLGRLPAAKFIQCHKSFVVNADKIARITSEEVLMEDGQSIPISRNFKNKTRDAFYTYLAQGI